MRFAQSACAVVATKVSPTCPRTLNTQCDVADEAYEGIHVQHIFKHLCPVDDRPRFLR